MAKVVSLENGLRLILQRNRSGPSASVAVWVGAGSRYEQPQLNGAAHLIEHLVFQGTANRANSREISEAIEGIGGMLNAFTGQESTCFITKVPYYRLEQALDVLADLVRNPLFREDDFEKEKRVVTEEIHMHKDHPSDLGEMILFQLIYPDHPLGCDIAGSDESLAGFTLPAIREVWQESYCASNIVVSVCGNIEPEGVIESVTARFADLARGSRPTSTPPLQVEQRRFRVEHKDTAEAHLCLGGITTSRFDPDHYPLDILNAALGAGASSRLYHEVRDKLGLAYYVHSSLEYFLDSGCQIIEAGCDPQNTTLVLELIWQELEKIKRQGIEPRELERVVEYIKGGFLLRLEDTLSRALWLGEHLLLEDKVPTAQERIRRYEKVTVADVQRMAERFFQPANFSGVVVGPLEDERCWENLSTAA